MKFDEYIELLWTIKRDCDREQYYDELIRPLLKEAVKRIKAVKVVPTFDTRAYGKKNKERWRDITGTGDKYVWPDYIFVPIEFTHSKPVSPYVRVEFKTPNIEQSDQGLQYCPIIPACNKNKKEIEAELSQSPLIFTDGITWLFLNGPSDIDKIDSDIKKIGSKGVVCLLKIGKRSRKRYYVELFSDAAERFEKLKDKIGTFVENKIPHG